MISAVFNSFTAMNNRVGLRCLGSCHKSLSALQVVRASQLKYRSHFITYIFSVKSSSHVPLNIHSLFFAVHGVQHCTQCTSFRLNFGIQANVHSFFYPPIVVAPYHLRSIIHAHKQDPTKVLLERVGCCTTAVCGAKRDGVLHPHSTV